MSVQSHLEIRSAEGVVFSQPLAGPVVRCLAWGVDAMCIAAAVSVLGLVTRGLAWIAPDVALASSILAYFVVSIGYGIFCEWSWRGQTIGKRLLRLRVVDAEGLRLQPSQIAIRNLLRFVDALPVFYAVGGIACWMTARYQRLGDLAANTVVVRVVPATEPDLDQLLAGKYNSLRQYPHLEARLRQQVEPPEAALALEALLRREDFDPVARAALFGELAARFRARVGFPAEATEGISDEQYVRNVVDVLYRTRTGERLPH